MKRSELKSELKVFREMEWNGITIGQVVDSGVVSISPSKTIQLPLVQLAAFNMGLKLVKDDDMNPLSLSYPKVVFSIFDAQNTSELVSLTLQLKGNLFVDHLEINQATYQTLLPGFTTVVNNE